MWTSYFNFDPDYQVLNLIETRAKDEVIFLPPYSPDLMPLEDLFSEVKSIIKANDEVF